MPSVHLLWLSALVFSTGLFVALTKANAILVLVGIELMFQAAIGNFVLFGNHDPNGHGQVFALFIIATTVCETAVALAVIFKVYQHHKAIQFDQLRGGSREREEEIGL